MKKKIWIQIISHLSFEVLKKIISYFLLIN